jgi:hypothetical protein
LHSERVSHLKCYPLHCISLLWLLSSCTSPKLPDKAKSTLDDHIGRMVGTEVEYSMVSVQKASGAPDDLSLEALTVTNDFISGCPEARGGEETWCVVIDRQIEDGTGTVFSHFILRRQGEFWNALELDEKGDVIFFSVGCNNWYDADT